MVAEIFLVFLFTIFVVYVVLELLIALRRVATDGPQVYFDQKKNEASVSLGLNDGRKYHFVYQNGKWIWNDINRITKGSIIVAVVSLIVFCSGLYRMLDDVNEKIELVVLFFPILIIIAALFYYPFKAYLILLKEMKEIEKMMPQLSPAEVALQNKIIHSCMALNELLVKMYNGDVESVTNPFEPYSYELLKQQIEQYMHERQQMRLMMPPDKFWDDIVLDLSPAGRNQHIEIALWFDGIQSDLILGIDVKDDNCVITEVLTKE